MSLVEMLHPEFAEHVDSLQSLIAQAEQERPGPEDLRDLINSEKAWRASYDWAMRILYANRVEAMGGAVHCVPFLHPETCAKLIDMADGLAENGGWRKNDCEPGQYQIPEIVVAQRNQAMHDVLAGLAKYLDLYYALIYQAAPPRIASIQFTKYSKDDTAGGNWHHDLDSDYTAVVSLDPKRFKGGGTDVRVTPTSSCLIAPLPAGHALLFNGRHLHHCGRAVTSGERYLLTYWMSS